MSREAPPGGPSAANLLVNDLDTAIGLNLVGVQDVRDGSLGLLTQSGNIGLALMTEASREAVGVRGGPTDGTRSADGELSTFRR